MVRVKVEAGRGEQKLVHEVKSVHDHIELFLQHVSAQLGFAEAVKE